MGKETPYEKAEQRVNNSEALRLHKDFILADWTEGEDHFEWVATAPEAEILEWVEAGQ